MRAWIVLLFLPLAGCIDEPADDEPETNIWGTCPQYISGPALTAELDVDGNGTLLLDVNMTHLQGHPLDLYELQLTSDSSLELRFFAGDRRLGAVMYEPEPSTQPFLVLDGSQSVAIYLTALTQGTAADPSPLRIEATGTGGLGVEAQTWFRVCGR